MTEHRARPPETTPEALCATLLYRADFVAHDGTAMEFFEALDSEHKRVCEHHAAQIIRAWRKRQPKASRL